VGEFISYLFISMWWSSKGAWRTPWQRKLDEGMKASLKALASNGKWRRWYDFLIYASLRKVARGRERKSLERVTLKGNRGRSALNSSCIYCLKFQECLQMSEILAFIWSHLHMRKESRWMEWALILALRSSL